MLEFFFCIKTPEFYYNYYYYWFFLQHNKDIDRRPWEILPWGYHRTVLRSSLSTIGKPIYSSWSSKLPGYGLLPEFIINVSSSWRLFRKWRIYLFWTLKKIELVITPSPNVEMEQKSVSHPNEISKVTSKYRKAYYLSLRDPLCNHTNHLHLEEQNYHWNQGEPILN